MTRSKTRSLNFLHLLPPNIYPPVNTLSFRIVNTGVKYQTISSSSVNLGNIAYGGQASYVQAETVHQHLKAEQRPDKREYREELHHDLMATMMQQHQGINGKYPLMLMAFFSQS